MVPEVSLRAALLVGAGAAVGAWARWLASVHLNRAFPFATALVNVVGSFLLAFLLVAGSARGLLGAEARLFLAVGLLGAFTTMSAFAYDTIAFIERGEWARALWNVAANPMLSLLGAALGWALARLLAQPSV